MISFRLIRRIGKILRGGAGKKEIYLGTLTGAIIGFNPVFGLSLAVSILLTLLLNANIGFTLIGLSLGKLISLAIAPITFHTGFFIIHSIGLEGFFSYLVNLPILARMNLEIYAMIGSLPYAILVGLILGKILSNLVTKAREQMLKISEKEKVSKVTGNKLSRFLLWLVFGKQKISTLDVLNKESKTFRKSGIILVVAFIGMSLLFEFLFLDRLITNGIKSSIRAKTMAEVNIEKASLSFASGKIFIKNLEVTDPEKPSHNLFQIEQLESDLSITDLLRKRYVIDLLSGSNLQLDVPRKSIGKIYEKEEKKKKKEKKEEKNTSEDDAEFPVEKYFTMAQKYQPYAEFVYEYLRQEEKKKASTKDKIKSFKQQARESIKKHGYYKARVQLLKDSPAWVVKKIEIDNIALDNHLKDQKLLASELSSDPLLHANATKIQLYSEGSIEANAEIILRFDDLQAQHELKINYPNLPVTGESISEDSPIQFNSAQAQVQLQGKFSSDNIAFPFELKLYNADAKLKEGESLLGLDAENFNEAIKAIDPIEVSGWLMGSIKSPKLKIDYEEFKNKLKNQLIATGKKELNRKASKEINRGLNKLFKKHKKDDSSEVDTKAIEDAASDLLDSFFK